MLTRSDQMFSVLEADDLKEIISFEQAFYKAFSRIKNQSLIRQIWNWDDQQMRISCKNSYNDQQVICWRDKKGNAKAYIACSAEGAFSQFQYYGFRVPHSIDKYIEINALFTTGKHTNGSFMNELFIKPVCIPLLKDLRYDAMLATCAPRLLNMYIRWGWQLLAQNEIQGEQRFFLCYKI